MNQDDSFAAVAIWFLLIGLISIPAIRYIKNRHIKSSCPDCDNPIEFPARGLGQSVECPHCQSQIVLCRTAPKEKPQRTHWLKPSHVIAIVCVLLLCGTALYVYQDSKAQQLKRDQAAATLEAQKARDAVAAESNVPSLRERIEQARIVSQKQLQTRLNAMTQPDPQSELRRANDIAEQQRQIMADAEFNQRIQSRMQSFEQSEQNRKVINEIQEIGHDNRMKAINEQYQPQNQPWILKYNSFEKRWQYAPPNATLKYNGLENRWEFVP